VSLNFIPNLIWNVGKDRIIIVWSIFPTHINIFHPLNHTICLLMKCVAKCNQIRVTSQNNSIEMALVVLQTIASPLINLIFLSHIISETFHASIQSHPPFESCTSFSSCCCVARAKIYETFLYSLVKVETPESSCPAFIRCLIFVRVLPIQLLNVFINHGHNKLYAHQQMFLWNHSEQIKNLFHMAKLTSSSGNLSCFISF